MSDGGALAELIRWMEPTSPAALNNRRLTRIRVSLNIVLDLRDPTVIGLSLTDVIDDHDYTITQAVAAAALDRGIEGLIVPAASLVSPNLVILVENLSVTSRLEPLDWIDPRLFVDRSSQVRRLGLSWRSR